MVNHSLALVNREIELALIDSGQVNLSIAPVGEDSFSASLDSRPRGLTRYYRRRSSLPFDVYIRHQWPPNWAVPPEGHWVVIQPWEYGSLPLEWVQRINESVDEVWVPSTFVLRLYEVSGVDTARVQIVPNGVNSDFFRPGGTPFLVRSTKQFKFLFVGGTIHRKGIDVLLQAYVRAFNRDEDVVLIIKDMGTRNLYQGQGMTERIRALQESHTAPEILYVEDDLSDRQMVALYNACDCLVHPYRGEGFGLPVLEAMACGRPVVVTAGGATDDFVDDQVGYRIPSTRRVFGNREISGVRTVGDLWMLEPDAEILAEKMRWIFDHIEEARGKGRCARKRASEEWTWQKSAERAIERINALRYQPVFRQQRETDAMVLIDLRNCRGQGLFPLRTTLESLRQNSYAQLGVALWADDMTVEGNLLQGEFKELLVLRDLSLLAVLRELMRRFRSALLVYIPVPIWFSKQWVAQMLEVTRKADPGPKILVPSSNLEGIRTYVPFEGSFDEPTFQKFARTLWRHQRGTFQEITSSGSGVVAVNRECLELLPEPACREWRDWLMALRDKGCRTYWVKDTYLLRPPHTSPLAPEVSCVG